MNKIDIEHQLQILRPYITENKWQSFETVIKQRTRKFTVVLEDIYHEHNQSAILRSAECLGIQDVHFISNKHHIDISQGISRGSQKWLSLHYHNSLQHNTENALNQLKKQGYQIVVTKPPGAGAKRIEELNFSKPIALIMGTEKQGISSQADALADESIYFPMVGFTESFNVSVAFSLIAHSIVENLKCTQADWQLSELEQLTILLDWSKKCVKNSDKILYLSEPQK